MEKTLKDSIYRLNCFVENKPGVLARIVGLISGRGYNIHTLNVGPTEDGTVSRMKIDVIGTARVVDQIILQLRNCVNVIEVTSRKKESIYRLNCFVENKPGVLARIVGLISGRGYNIHTLNVGPTEDGTVSRMKIDVIGTARVVDQIILQLRNCVNVIEVTSRRKEDGRGARAK